jgi:hypothetical protein
VNSNHFSSEANLKKENIRIDSVWRKKEKKVKYISTTATIEAAAAATTTTTEKDGLTI